MVTLYSLSLHLFIYLSSIFQQTYLLISYSEKDVKEKGDGERKKEIVWIELDR